MNQKKILLASPRGFCAGVARAVSAVEETLRICGVPVYVKHEIVHNRHVVADLERKGAITIESLSEVPAGSVVVFSAHGSPRAHYEEARERKLTLIDATCPLVTKVHLELLRYLKEGYQVLYIGHRGHIEGMGVLGEAPGALIPVIETVSDVDRLSIENPEKLVYLTQTTLSIDETADIITVLKRKYPQIIAPPLQDICFATTNRQTAVKALAEQSELVLIFGSQNSSNSRRLMETVRSAGVESYLVDDISMVEETWLFGKGTIGISAGASAPEQVISDAVEFFRQRGYPIGDFQALEENMQFTPPPELVQLRVLKQ
ncbi:MAG: 4-hydroxy-3-methylbut-2-enyl diphosphate reductase [Candidatus Moranbacteria bacterium]|nr:4-hydroxy-3-methylbut-2-enyl diphosphate reductase [Candidatus Moranbacteria bacterium]